MSSGDGIASAPTGLARTADGQVLTIFRSRSEIQRFLPTGEFLGMSDAGLKNPMGICVEPRGRIWVADRNFAPGQVADGIVLPSPMNR